MLSKAPSLTMAVSILQLRNHPGHVICQMSMPHCQIRWGERAVGKYETLFMSAVNDRVALLLGNSVMVYYGTWVKQIWVFWAITGQENIPSSLWFKDWGNVDLGCFPGVYSYFYHFIARSQYECVNILCLWFDPAIVRPLVTRQDWRTP